MNNGNFHVLKCDVVTISFYPTTKTVNVQGAMKDILSYVTLSEDSSAESTELVNHVNYGVIEEAIGEAESIAAGKQIHDKDMKSDIDGYEDTYSNKSVPDIIEKLQSC